MYGTEIHSVISSSSHTFWLYYGWEFTHFPEITPSVLLKHDKILKNLQKQHCVSVDSMFLYILTNFGNSEFLVK